MDTLTKFSQALETYIRPSTFPIAVKLLKSEADIPPGVERAAKALGYSIPPCLAYGLARHNGASMAMLKEDIMCPIAGIWLGLAEPPEPFLKGVLYLGTYMDCEEAGARTARELPKFQPKQYVGLVTSPLNARNFEADAVLVYANPLQVWRLITGALYKEGGRLQSSFSVSGGCGVLVTVKQTGKCQITIPGSGDRKAGGTAADELMFAAPVDRLDEIAAGLAYTHEHGIRLPWKQWVGGEYTQPEKYKGIAKLLGIG